MVLLDGLNREKKAKAYSLVILILKENLSNFNDRYTLDQDFKSEVSDYKSLQSVFIRARNFKFKR